MTKKCPHSFKNKFFSFLNKFLLLLAKVCTITHICWSGATKRNVIKILGRLFQTFSYLARSETIGRCAVTGTAFFKFAHKRSFEFSRRDSPDVFAGRFSCCAPTNLPPRREYEISVPGYLDSWVPWLNKDYSVSNVSNVSTLFWPGIKRMCDDPN